MILSAVFPFCCTHFHMEDVPYLCCVPEDSSPVRRASFYNSHRLNLIRRFDPHATSPVTDDALLPLLMKDRTPGFQLCEIKMHDKTCISLAAKLEKGSADRLVLRLPELLCTFLPKQTGKNAVYVPTVLENLAACTPPSMVFINGEITYAVKPIHDPVACRTLTDALAGCILEPIGTASLPDAGSAVLIYFEKPVCQLAAGLVMDSPDVF